jgi:hypothetical protein
MRTACIELLAVLAPGVLPAASPAIVLFDLTGATRQVITETAGRAENLQRFCAEGVTIVDVKVDLTRPTVTMAHSLVAEGEESPADRLGNDLWLIAPVSLPLSALEGRVRFFAPDLGERRWRAFRSRFGLPGPLSAAELEIAAEVRARFGPPLERIENMTAAAACAGSLPDDRDTAVIPALDRAVALGPPLTVAVLGSRLATAGEAHAAAARVDALAGRIHERLARRAANDEQPVFVLVCAPPGPPAPADPAAKPEARMGTGCAILWGKPFERGVVALDPISWPRLRATILHGIVEGSGGEPVPAGLKDLLAREEPAPR